jgi:DNA replication protein DnaC
MHAIRSGGVLIPFVVSAVGVLISFVGGCTTVSSLLSGTNIPAQFSSVRFDDYVFDDERGDPNALKTIQEWDPSVAKPSMLMYGDPGLGKTMLACALINEYQDAFRKPKNVTDEGVITLLRQQRYPAYFIQLSEWVGLQIRSFKLQEESMRGIRDPEEYLELDQLLQDLHHRVQLLVVDDVGKEHTTASGFAQDAFDLLVRTRHNKGLCTVYTTNLPMSAWSANYSESMESLIRRASTHVRFRH